MIFVFEGLLNVLVLFAFLFMPQFGECQPRIVALNRTSLLPPLALFALQILHSDLNPCTCQRDERNVEMR